LEKDRLTIMPPQILKLVAALSIFAAAACTHQGVLTPTFSPQSVSGVRAGSICPAGQVVAVSTTNRSPEGNSAGTTEAGVHTFKYRFASDPALVLQQGIEHGLQAGGCKLGSPSEAGLSIELLKVESKSLACGFVTCDGEGQSVIQVTLSDRGGRPVLQELITSATTKGCGMIICNEEEVSEIASTLLNDAITKTLGTFGTAIAKHLAAPPPAESPAKVSEPPELTPAFTANPTDPAVVPEG
jgi:hypothetical protein